MSIMADRCPILQLKFNPLIRIKSWKERRDLEEQYYPFYFQLNQKPGILHQQHQVKQILDHTIFN